MVHTICLSCAPIHSPWTQKKRHSFLNRTRLFCILSFCGVCGAVEMIIVLVLGLRLLRYIGFRFLWRTVKRVIKRLCMAEHLKEPYLSMARVSDTRSNLFQERHKVKPPSSAFAFSLTLVYYWKVQHSSVESVNKNLILLRFSESYTLGQVEPQATVSKIFSPNLVHIFTVLK